MPLFFYCTNFTYNSSFSIFVILLCESKLAPINHLSPHYHVLPKSTPYLGLFASCLNFHIGPLIWPVPALFGLVRLHHRPEQFKHFLKLLWLFIRYSDLYRHIILLSLLFVSPSLLFSRFFLYSPYAAGGWCWRTAPRFIKVIYCG